MLLLLVLLAPAVIFAWLDACFKFAQLILITTIVYN